MKYARLNVIGSEGENYKNIYIMNGVFHKTHLGHFVEVITSVGSRKAVKRRIDFIPQKINDLINDLLIEFAFLPELFKPSVHVSVFNKDIPDSIWSALKPGHRLIWPKDFKN